MPIFRKQKAVFAVVLSVFVALVCSYKGQVNEERRAKFRERTMQYHAAMDLGHEAIRSVKVASAMNMTSDEFTKKFGPITEMKKNTPQQRQDGVATYRYLHPGSQAVFTLSFRNEKLTGYSLHYGTDDIKIPIVTDSSAFIASETIRNETLGLCILGWVILLIFGLKMPRHRKRIGLTLTTMAGISIICMYLKPQYTQDLQGILSNDSLSFGALMFIGSLCLFIFRDSPAVDGHKEVAPL